MRRVVVPVAIAPGHTRNDLQLRTVHRGCGARLATRRECPEHGLVADDETQRAFEPSPGVYVLVGDDELEAIAPAADRVIDVRACVPEGSIDPLLVERSYHLVPDGPQSLRRGYALVAETLADGRLAGLARFGAWGGEQLCAVAAKHGCSRQLILRVLHPAEDLVAYDLDRQLRGESFSEEEADLAARLVDRLTRRYNPQLLTSNQRSRVAALLEAKLAGGCVQPPVSRKPAASPPTVDLADALRRSLR